jgi:hypothetical protein
MLRALQAPLNLVGNYVKLTVTGIPNLLPNCSWHDDAAERGLTWMHHAIAMHQKGASIESHGPHLREKMKHERPMRICVHRWTGNDPVSLWDWTHSALILIGWIVLSGRVARVPKRDVNSIVQDLTSLLLIGPH